MPSSDVFFNKALIKLKEFPDNCFHSFVTDPPYGLGEEPDPLLVLKDWLDHGYHEVKNKGGFMGKEWDKFVPQPIEWKEVYRTLRPGGYLVCACGTRTYDWMTMAIRLAGFEIRDVISWHYGSGFPKSKDISKALDDFFKVERPVIGKRKHPTLKDQKKIKESKSAVHTLENSWEREWNLTEAVTDEAKKYAGYGTSLKPATEFFIIARKPISENTLAENILKWGTGGINIAGCRIGSEKLSYTSTFKRMIDNNKDQGYRPFVNGNNGGEVEKNVTGRFPANIILSHHPDCKCLGTKKIKAISGGTGDKSMGGMGKKGKYGKYKLDKLGDNAGGLGDEEGNEVVEDWQCVEGCPIKELDEQSGELVSGKKEGAYRGWGTSGIYGPGEAYESTCYADTGGASRFFYCAKASKSERNKGLEHLGFKRTLGHNRFDKCKNCGGYILQNPDRDSACKCDHPEREDNIVEGNYHPTVKPVALMRWLVKLVTPPGGKVCDPYNGSGTTGIGCKLEGFDYTGIEQDEDMVLMSIYRIRAWEPEYAIPQNSLFADL